MKGYESSNRQFNAIFFLVYLPVRAACGAMYRTSFTVGEYCFLWSRVRECHFHPTQKGQSAVEVRTWRYIEEGRKRFIIFSSVILTKLVLSKSTVCSFNTSQTKGGYLSFRRQQTDRLTLLKLRVGEREKERRERERKERDSKILRILRFCRGARRRIGLGGTTRS